MFTGLMFLPMPRRDPRRPAKPIRVPTYAGPDRRSIPNGNNPTNGNGRDWTSLKAWANAIATLGIPGAIAIFLVYMGATEIPKLSRNVDLLLVEIRQIRELIVEDRRQRDQLLRVTERACANAARDDYARQRCYDR